MNILGLISLPDWLLVTALVLSAFYKYLTWNFGYWKSQNVPTPRPIPLFGTLLPVFRKSLVEIDIENKKRFGDVWGIYVGRKPELITADLDLIKAIAIKDFHHFTDRRSMTAVTLGGKKKVSHYFLPILRGEEWKAHRSVLSPTFTSGKLKQMGVIMEDCAKQLNQFVSKSIENGKTELEIKEICGLYTMNVMASCCFGYQIDSQNPKDPFIIATKALFSHSFNAKVLFSLMMPKSFKYLGKVGISASPEKLMDYFQKIVTQVIGMRKEEKNRRGDFLDLLMDAEKNESEDTQYSEDNDLSHYDIGSELQENGKTYKRKNEKVLNADAIVGHSITFLLAGYDSTSGTISHAIYFMALYPEYQEKLVKEIEETIRNHGKINYDSVGGMRYLDKVISETLRFYPVTMRAERRCVKPYTMGEIKIPEDMVVGIPIFAIHHDERYYPNPEIYDPERFSAENKAQRNPVTYIPFGIGPRNCIGMRFALTEAKIALGNFFREFRVSKCSKTEIPLTMQAGNSLTRPVNGVYVKVEKRH